jgi:probable F420-dependent oxidoreductase
MKVGLAFASSIGIEGSEALEICKRAEAAGFESVWGGEHVIMPDSIGSKYPYTEDGKIPAEPETPIPDPLIWLGFAAAAAPTLKLGTCILIVPQRNPLILAKELATLDRISGGRVELGLGVGWMKEEFDALGVPWDARGRRNDEYIEAMRELWKAPHAEYHGDFVDFDPCTCSPRPVNGDIPVIVGGDSEAALNRAVKLAQGYFPGEGDPASIEINAMFGIQMADPVAGIEQMASAGVGRVMVPAFFFAGPGGLDRMEEFAEKVMPAAKSAA